MYKVILQNIQAAHHLREDKDLVASSFHFWKKFINKNQFPSRLDHCLQMEVRSTWAVCFFKLSKDFLFSTYQRIDFCIYSIGIPLNTYQTKLLKSVLVFQISPISHCWRQNKVLDGSQALQEHLFLCSLKTSLQFLSRMPQKNTWTEVKLPFKTAFWSPTMTEIIAKTLRA